MLFTIKGFHTAFTPSLECIKYLNERELFEWSPAEYTPDTVKAYIPAISIYAKHYKTNIEIVPEDSPIMYVSRIYDVFLSVVWQEQVGYIRKPHLQRCWEVSSRRY